MTYILNVTQYTIYIVCFNNNSKKYEVAGYSKKPFVAQTYLKLHAREVLDEH